MPKAGYKIDVDWFMKKNFFQGTERGPGAIVDVALKNKLPEGVFLIHAFKQSGRGHCVAMRYVNDTMVIFEESKTTGIMENRWIDNIRFIRSFLFASS